MQAVATASELDRRTANCEQREAHKAELSAPLGLPRHIPIVWPLSSKYCRNCFLTTGAVHLVFESVILAIELQKLRNPALSGVVVASFQNRGLEVVL
jgi:hypothetical protein